MTVTRDDLLRAHPYAMSQTYSDFPHYLRQPSSPMMMVDEDGNERLYRTLPREFQVIQESRVPLLQIMEDEVDHPFFQDFVILAEFSEVEGPIPLCTIPDNVRLSPEMCLNRFAVHLMSVDYQVNDVGQFRITEDTQVLRKNVWQGVNAFMQYFTLNDLKARGFVRPFCFGYISNDHVKLDKKLDVLIKEFGKMTKLLKYANRKWFARELQHYLGCLGQAIDNFQCDINDASQSIGKNSEMDYGVSQEQLVQQFSEIENILKTAQSHDKDKGHGNEDYEQLEDFFNNSLSSHNEHYEFMDTIHQKGIGFSIDRFKEVTEPFHIPLVHPLKRKGESLRPLTILGQLGTVYLLWKLWVLHTELRKDTAFSEMNALTEDFTKHCKTEKETRSTNNRSSHQNIPNNSICQSLIAFCEYQDTLVLIDKLHISSNPSPSNTSSSSYYTPTESDSVNTLSILASQEHDHRPTVHDNSNPPWKNKVPEEEEEAKPTRRKLESHRSDLSSTSSEQFSDYTESEQDYSLSSKSKTFIEEVVHQKSWWEYVEVKLVRGNPGYGILKVFKSYSKMAHHIVYSILIGRPIVICGNEEQRSKVGRIITAFIPFVPTNKSTHSTWKVLRWHQGVLMESHLAEYKLIGICIPERLNIHDLISSRDQNSVTIFNLAQKKSVLLGPAYSGKFFSWCETGSSPFNHFFKSDLSFITFLEGLLTEIQTKVYMLKCMEEKDGKKSLKRNAHHFKQLELTSSDIDIVRYLSTLCSGPEEALEIF